MKFQTSKPGRESVTVPRDSSDSSACACVCYVCTVVCRADRVHVPAIAHMIF